MRFLKLRSLLATLALAASTFVGASSAYAQVTPPPSVAPDQAMAPVSYEEEMQAFASHVTVREDGTIGVVERIDYFFPDSRHGIFRDIPLRYNVDGKVLKMPVDVRSVVAPDGSPWPYEVQKNRDSIRIKIGDPDRTLRGAQSYVITYEVSGALRYFGDHDELYWNVTGNGWTVPIRKSSAQVSLPAAVDSSSVIARCFTGAAGSTAQDCLGRPQGKGASFVANGPLTVVVGWNKGVTAVIAAEEVGLFEKYGALLPLALPFLVLIGLVVTWRKHGRDPEGRGTIMVQYEPPAGMTPVEMAGLCAEEVSSKDISSIIVHLAIRGYIRIDEIEKKGLFGSTDYEFHKLKEYQNDKSLLPFEADVMEALFASVGTFVRVSAISQQHLFYKKIQPIKTDVFSSLVAGGYFPHDPSKVRATYSGIGILALFVLFFFGINSMFSGSVYGNAILGLLISAVLFLFFARLMPRRTPKGVEAYEHALGFKDYLSTAEKYRLQWQETENVFEKFLPYAMVFGVVDKWSKAFETINLPPMNWYHGSSGINAFNAVAFSSAINSMNSAVSSAMASAPANSSGGSGFSGGSSGGGGGGGGGGSW